MTVRSHLTSIFQFKFYNTDNLFSFYKYFNKYLPNTIIINKYKESLQFMLHIKKQSCHIICINIPQHKTVLLKKHGAFAVLDAPILPATLEEILYYSLDKNKKIS